MDAGLRAGDDRVWPSKDLILQLCFKTNISQKLPIQQAECLDKDQTKIKRVDAVRQESAG
jgi:hypothetical protein